MKFRGDLMKSLFILLITFSLFISGCELFETGGAQFSTNYKTIDVPVCEGGEECNLPGGINKGDNNKDYLSGSCSSLTYDYGECVESLTPGNSILSCTGNLAGLCDNVPGFPVCEIPTEQCDFFETVYQNCECISEGAPACGDGIVNQESEECDGEDLNQATCTSKGFNAGGNLACHSSGLSNECTFDISECLSSYCENVFFGTCGAPAGEDIYETHCTEEYNLGCGGTCYVAIDSDSCGFYDPALGGCYCLGDGVCDTEFGEPALSEDCRDCTPGAVNWCDLPNEVGTCGECNLGQKTCKSNGEWGRCEQITFPIPEDRTTCENNQDDDCDCTPDHVEADCVWHLECIDQQCVEVQGPGEEQCTAVGSNECVLIPGDINGDGLLNIHDVDAFASDFYGDYNARSDFNLDGVINLGDVILFIGIFKDGGGFDVPAICEVICNREEEDPSKQLGICDCEGLVSGNSANGESDSFNLFKWLANLFN